MEENKYFEKIKEAKYLANKEIGQNFLINKEICKQIVNSLEIKEDDYVLEIGCGFGSLTYYLSEICKHLDVIDIDERCITYVNENTSSKFGRHVFKENALTLDLSKYTKIISNLPYYITSSIIERILLEAKNVNKCVFMVQKEAYYRIIADKNTKEYSPLSILLKYRCDYKELFKVNRNNFVPAPNVDSLVFSLSFKETDLELDNFYKVVKTAFGFRRKTIYNNLKQLGLGEEKLNGCLKEANISATMRPEQLSLEDYVRLTKILKQYF